MISYVKYWFLSVLTSIFLLIPMNAISQRWWDDILVYDGPITCFDVDYTMDGKIYVGLQKDSTNYPMSFYTSSDHGMTWDIGYQTAGSLGRISKMKIVVGEPLHNYFYFFFLNPLDSFPWVWRIASDFSGSPTSFRIDTFPYDEAGFDAARSIEDDYSIVFAGASTGPSSNYYPIKCYRSTDYGATWDKLSYGFGTPVESRQELSLAWGPPSNYYLSFVATKDLVGPYDPDSSEIKIFYSTNGGSTWGWSEYVTNNSVRDGDPHIAASNDINYPAIWIASPRAGAGGNNDLYVHYVLHPDSIDVYDPLPWPSTPIATTSVSEYWGDIEFYKASSNLYVNMTWIYDDGISIRDVHWTWSAGSDPGNWYEDRTINEYPAHPWPCGAAPRVVYSPGAPASGGGVVYAGFGSQNLYFDAPWVAGIEEKVTGSKIFSIGPEIVTTNGTLLLSVPEDGSFGIKIYDVIGRLIDETGPQFMKAGSNSIHPKLKENGIYFIEVMEGNFRVYREKIIKAK